MRTLLIYLLAAFLMLSGCGTAENKNAKVAKDYLKSMGYKIVSYEGTAGEYVLTKEKLTQMPYMQYWGLQREDPGKYIGKTITVEKFIVKNHPLDNWESSSKFDPVKSKGKTIMWVFLADNRVVGGISYPVVDKMLYGSVWSIDGKTLEEVHSISYSEWLEQWMSRFR
ncbi:hypothetical protein [Thermosediminibacter litoriperuensis]|uniref:DUF4830 domain-containing protein n=1 Tax=Thermosediminibacter litoriperuensis TaxID=291989 RepID=A0A5S5AL32_9FIRM|nr:hypothetical protein [Thermosediminibacter litoriperuensis]TYP50348.1 hypothetical protein LZ11_02077 [Thermosediminibacter litoriperuensis]